MPRSESTGAAAVLYGDRLIRSLDATAAGHTASTTTFSSDRGAERAGASFHRWLIGSLIRSSMTRFRNRAP